MKRNIDQIRQDLKHLSSTEFEKKYPGVKASVAWLLATRIPRRIFLHFLKNVMLASASSHGKEPYGKLQTR